MSIMMVTECARGCTIAADDETSRIPAPAFDGATLCPRCLARIGWNLGEAADTAARARLALVPGMGAQGERVSGSREPGAPLNIAAMEACDNVVGCIGRWTVYWANTLQIAPPVSLAGAQADDRDVLGVQAGTDPETVAAAIDEWAWWLKAHLWRYQHHTGMSAFHDELRDVISKTAKQFPRDGERVIEQHPRYCPICELQKVWLAWPDRHGDPVVSCKACGWEYETDWKEMLDAIGIGAAAEA